MLNSNLIHEALKLLNSKMVYEQVDPIEFVVCGGAALIVAKLVSRATRDVDIVALAHARGTQVELLQETRLPAELKRLAAEVGIDLGIESDWLNFGPSPLLKFGLPPGLSTRLRKRPYGDCLTVYFIGRLDQVHFKIYAAMDPKEGTRHLSDLLDLKPTEHEVKAAVSWLLGRKVSAQFKGTLQQVLERIDHERIAQQI
jgi:hypothetical protein